MRNYFGHDGHWRLDAAGAAILLTLGAGAYLLQIGPAWSHREQSIARAGELVAEQGQSRELERKVHALKEQLDTHQRAVDKNELKLEPASELNRRLAALTELCAASGLQVDSIESGETRRLDRYATIAVRITGRGSYRTCATLLSHMHEQMPDVGVIGLDMSSVGLDAGNNRQATASFAFDLLWHTKPIDRPLKK